MQPPLLQSVLHLQKPLQKPLVERVLQFGQGNFLRSFCGWMFSEMNQKLQTDFGIVMVQPIAEGNIEAFEAQQCCYTVCLQGYQEGKPSKNNYLCRAVPRGLNPFTRYNDFLALAHQPDLEYVISNTTEAGIEFCSSDTFEEAPAVSFPGKVTRLLFERYKAFDGDREKGWIFLPCELIEKNGTRLREAILQYVDLWQLGESFKQWVETACYFCNTLVDRIVPGFPASQIPALWDELGYEDPLCSMAEPFHLWVIETSRDLSARLPFREAGLNVLWVPDVTPYRNRKVYILNGIHTGMTPMAWLMGLETVSEALGNSRVAGFVQKLVYQEILPMLTLPADELNAFADEVFLRFRNPFLRHELQGILLNSASKFKARNLPIMLSYIEQKGQIPPMMALSLSALIFYFRGIRLGQPIAIRDTAEMKALFEALWSRCDGTPAACRVLVEEVLSNPVLWGRDLAAIPHLSETVSTLLYSMVSRGVESTVDEALANA